MNRNISYFILAAAESVTTKFSLAKGSSVRAICTRSGSTSRQRDTFFGRLNECLLLSLLLSLMACLGLLLICPNGSWPGLAGTLGQVRNIMVRVRYGLLVLMDNVLVP